MDGKKINVNSTLHCVADTDIYIYELTAIHPILSNEYIILHIYLFILML
jgi:hypothetical protein